MVKTKSLVWKYFTEEMVPNSGQKLGRCRYCSKTYCSNAARMWGHLLKCQEAPEHVYKEIVRDQTGVALARAEGSAIKALPSQPLVRITEPNYYEQKMSLENILHKIDTEKLKFVRFEFGDIYGISRSKIIPARHFIEKVTHGIAIPLGHLLLVIDGSFPLVQTPYRDGIIGTGDAIWRPDISTFRILPWCRDTATILVEPTDKNAPVTFYPRVIARKQIERLENLGLSLLAAHEHEFYVVDSETGKPFTQDTMLRATIRNYTDPEFLYQMMEHLFKVGIDVEMTETESGPGQVEITYKPAFGIQSADNAHLFKTTVKEIAQKHGYIASFMSKPYHDQPGSSAHLNHSLWDKDGKQNLFNDLEQPTGLSRIGQHWMAGILNHSRALSMLMAPTINCYKRFEAQSLVSSDPTWGYDNRMCMLRVKSGTTGTYIENRHPGAGSNPYLTLAATIAAGIDGIQRKLQLPPETTDIAVCNNDGKGITHAPSNLQEAMDAFKADDVMNKEFGEDFCEVFFALKAYEMKIETCERDASEMDSYQWDRKQFFNYL